MITVNNIKESVLHKDAEYFLMVNGEPVWDYKPYDGTLYLIHEKVKGSNEYPQVTLDELKQELSIDEQTYLPIASETLGGLVLEVQELTSKSGRHALDLIVEEDQ